MKKKIITIMALLCIVSVLFALVACNGNDTPGDNGTSGQPSGDVNEQPSGDVNGQPSEDVNESEQFRHIMSVVLNEFGGRLKNSVLLSALSEGTISGDNNGFEKLSALQEVYDYMKDVNDKEAIEEKFMNEIALRNFIVARAYGELINKICDSDKIYNKIVEIKEGSNTIPMTSYAVILSEGTHIIVYLYGNANNERELVYKWDIDYISDTQFSARMIMLSMSQLDSNNNQDVYAYYTYGDTDGDSLLSTYDGNGSGDTIYKNSDEEVCYRSLDFDVTKQCLSKVKSQFDSIDIELIRSLKDSCQNSTSRQEYDKIADALFEQYGLA